MGEAVHPSQSSLTLRIFWADTAHMQHTQSFPNAKRVHSVGDRQSVAARLNISRLSSWLESGTLNGIYETVLLPEEDRRLVLDNN